MLGGGRHQVFAPARRRLRPLDGEVVRFRRPSVGPFISLGDAEMNSHDDALMRPSPRSHGRPGFRPALGQTTQSSALARRRRNALRRSASCQCRYHTMLADLLHCSSTR